MQVVVNSANIKTFGFTVLFDVPNQSVIFDIAALTEFFGNGGTLIAGINFAINDSSGNPLITGNSGNGTWNWGNPNILVPSTNTNPDYSGESTYTLDLRSVWGDNYSILFQSYFIQGAIKDDTGIVYQTTVSVQEVCQPVGLTDLGYIEGEFVVKADCPNGYISVKDVTNVSYNKKLPSSRVSEGSFFYPRGTIDPIEWADYNSPVNFSNQVVYTGNYKVQNTTTCVYAFQDGFNISLEYYTDSEKYNVTCEKHMLYVMCCVTETQQKIEAYCTGNEAEYLKGLMLQALPYMWIGLENEASGRDSSEQAAAVRRILNCKCNKKGIRQISPDPVNPLVYNIVVDGQWGSSVIPAVLGNTKTFTVRSNVYIVAKKVPSDTAFIVETDTSVQGIVTYRISFNYDALAFTLLNAIGANQSLLTQFNALVWNNGVLDISSINGKCVLDISSVNYFLSYRVPVAATLYKNVRINGVTYNAPTNLLVSNENGAEAWLNGLGLGSYETTFTAGTGTSIGSFFVNILSINNQFTPESVTFNNAFGDATISFQKVTKNILALLQAMINYMCELDATKIKLGANVSVCYFNYNGDPVQVTYTSQNTQADLNAALASSNCSIVAKIAGTSPCVPVDVVGEILLPDAVANQAYEYSFNITGSSPFSVVNNGFPDWMVIEVEGNTVFISGTPETSDVGEDVQVSFEIENCGGDRLVVDQDINVSDSCVTIGVVSGLPLPDGADGAPYNTSVTLGGTMPFQIEGIVKPSWMNITLEDNIVTLEGTPTDNGTYNVQFTITQDCGDGVLDVDQDIEISPIINMVITNQVNASYQEIAITNVTVDNSTTMFDLPPSYSCGNLQTVSGSQSGWSGVVRVYFTPSPIDGELRLSLSKNVSELQVINVDGSTPSPIVFTTETFLESDSMVILIRES